MTNDPSPIQFISANRKLIVHSDLQDIILGNCLPQESVPILKDTSCSSLSVQQINCTFSSYRLADPDLADHPSNEYSLIPDQTLMFPCSEHIATYIAGFVVFRLKPSLLCEICVDALISDNVSDSVLYTVYMKIGQV